jgi:tetratricopeptide (TPR) repeat protein
MQQSPKLRILCTGLGLVFIVCISVTHMNKPLYALTSQNNKTITSAPLVETGNALYRLGKYIEAIIFYDKALAIYPNDANALDYKGAALVKLGNYDEAITFLDKALAINPKDNVALQTKIIALIEKFQLITIIMGFVISIITYILAKRTYGRSMAFIFAITAALIVIVVSFLTSSFHPFG